MQAIENWANVTGRLVSIAPHPQLQGYVSAALEVHDVAPVPGFANLFDSAKAQTIQVNLPAAAAPKIENKKGSIVSWKIRKAGPLSNFAHVDLDAT